VPTMVPRCCGEKCPIVKLRSDGREEILKQGLMRADAEMLYYICIGETERYEHSAPQVERQRIGLLARVEPSGPFSGG
jgi:hypothetical protein